MTAVKLTARDDGIGSESTRRRDSRERIAHVLAGQLRMVGWRSPEVICSWKGSSTADEGRGCLPQPTGVWSCPHGENHPLPAKPWPNCVGCIPIPSACRPSQLVSALSGSGRRWVSPQPGQRRKRWLRRGRRAAALFHAGSRCFKLRSMGEGSHRCHSIRSLPMQNRCESVR
jgi:hypothetical protein